MRRSRSSSLLALLFVGALAVPAGAAQSAAPAYVSSEPSNGEELHQAPNRVEVTFNEPLDESSELAVKDSCGRAVDDGNVTVDTNTISVGIARKPSGHYVASYSAKGLGGITGTTNGEFHFEVHGGTPCGKKPDKDHDHDDDDDDGGKDKDHGDHDDRNDDRSDHDDHNGGSMGDEHSGTNHDSTGSRHDAGTHTGDDTHDDMGHNGSAKNNGKKHGGKHGNGHGRNHKVGDLREDPDGRIRADGPGAPFGAPNGTAVLLALGLSLGLGVVGGWFLRISGGR